MEKISYDELFDIMSRYNEEHNNNPATPLTGVIVYSSDNWDKPYTETERSYRVSSRNNAFEYGKISNSIYGDCLDELEWGVRLDYYNWKVDYCYMEGEENDK